jgi:hypothetical protein
MSRSPQTLAPVHPSPPFWARVIPLFARLWHVIWWIWTTVIVGGLLVGIIISLATNGTSGLTDPSTWVVVHSLLAHLLLTIIGLLIAGIITLLAYLAHRHQKKAARAEKQVHDESFVDVAKGVRTALTAVEELMVKTPANSPSPSNAMPPTQAIPPGSTWNVPFRRNPLFTGRQDVLKRLHDQLPTGKDKDEFFMFQTQF